MCSDFPRCYNFTFLRLKILYATSAPKKVSGGTGWAQKRFYPTLVLRDVSGSKSASQLQMFSAQQRALQSLWRGRGTLCSRRFGGVWLVWVIQIWRLLKLGLDWEKTGKSMSSDHQPIIFSGCRHWKANRKRCWLTSVLWSNDWRTEWLNDWMGWIGFWKTVRAFSYLSCCFSSQIFLTLKQLSLSLWATSLCSDLHFMSSTSCLSYLFRCPLLLCSASSLC